MMRILVEEEPPGRSLSLHVKDNAIIRIQSVMPAIKIQSVMPAIKIQSVMPAIKIQSVMPATRIQSVKPTLRMATRPRIVDVSTLCRMCKASASIDANFCTECGQRLAGRPSWV
jgi:hypothetical protein